MAITLRYFTEFGENTFQHVTAASICDGIYARVLYSVVGVRYRRIESSRSLSHLLMSFLYHFAGLVSTTANTKCLYFKCIRKKHV